jgi:hypothetical protein
VRREACGQSSTSLPNPRDPNRGHAELSFGNQQNKRSCHE